MIRDLRGAGARTVDAEVLVIGGGTAGLAMAARLARRGLSVVCLESGGREQREETHPLNAVEQAGTPYAGAEYGRFRCLGGTSTRWGGALIPFQAADLDPAAWPLDPAALAPYAAEVERLFGLPDGPYETVREDGLAGYVERLAKWPPFANRNVYTLLRGELEAPAGPTVWLNATVTRLALDGARMSGVVAEAPDGSSLTVSARQVVVAAGAIETTRLLLLADRQNGGRISRTSPSLGRGFHDHLSAAVADLAVRDRAALNARVGFRFAAHGAMRNLRFELAPASPLRAMVPPSFAHVAAADEPGGGFDALRELFRGLQRRRLPGIGTLARLARAAPWLARAVWWRFARKRLLYPDHAALQVHMVIEQAAVPENRIALSKTMTDPFGLPLARIAWAVREDDEAAMGRATEAFVAAWASSPLAEVARIVPRPPAGVAADMRAGGGIYHPGGSTRMARDAADGVVDGDLRLFAADNVRVVSTSVFPSGGGANPTMTLLMLALRCADQLAEESAERS